jgi:hypothetical protein
MGQAALLHSHIMQLENEITQPCSFHSLALQGTL